MKNHYSPMANGMAAFLFVEACKSVKVPDVTKHNEGERTAEADAKEAVKKYLRSTGRM